MLKNHKRKLPKRGVVTTSSRNILKFSLVSINYSGRRFNQLHKGNFLNKTLSIIRPFMHIFFGQKSYAK
jgi:hypothetical protein